MDKITDLKIYIKLLAILSAGVMMLTSLPALAEGEKEDNINATTAITMMDENQEQPSPAEIVKMLSEKQDQLNIDEYNNMVKEVIPELLNPYTNNDYAMYGYLTTAYYYYNYAYCREVRDDLIDAGYIGEDLNEQEYKAASFSRDLANINNKILKKNISFDAIFDFSILIKDPELRELTHNALVNYIKVYEKATIDCYEYKELLEQLKVLKKDCYYIGYYGIYCMMLDLYGHIIITNFDKKELNQYYVIKDEEITSVNKKKYKNWIELESELRKKKNRTPLEEIMLLRYKYVTGAQNDDDVSKAIVKIKKDYREYINEQTTNKK